MDPTLKKGIRKKNSYSLLKRYLEGLLIVMMIGLISYTLLFVTMLLF